MGELKREGDSWFEDKQLILAALKDLEETHGVKMLTRSEFKGRGVLQRWICARHPFNHGNFWRSPATILEHAENGESGCDICRQIYDSEPEVVSFKDLNEGALAQEARSEKSVQRSRQKSRRGGQVARYTV